MGIDLGNCEETVAASLPAAPERCEGGCEALPSEYVTSRRPQSGGYRFATELRCRYNFDPL